MIHLTIVLLGAVVGWVVGGVIFVLHTDGFAGLDYLLNKLPKKFPWKKTPQLPPPQELFPRPTPLNIFDEEVFNQWLLVSDNRTLDDYCEFETEAEKSVRQDKEYRDWEFDLLTRPYATSGSYVPPNSPFITESVHRPGDILPPEWRNRQEEDIYEDSVAEQLAKNGGVIPLYSNATGVYTSIERQLLGSMKNDQKIPLVNKYGYTKDEVDAVLDQIIEELGNTYGESD